LLTGWVPYPDPHYHTVKDRFEYVDLPSVARSTKLALCLLMHIDRHGAP